MGAAKIFRGVLRRTLPWVRHLPLSWQRALKKTYLGLASPKAAGAQKALLHDGARYRHAPSRDRPRGVNLVGYAFAQRGVGEHLRLTHKALDAARVPHGVLNRDALVATQTEEEKGLLPLISEETPYACNLLCFNPPQTLLLGATEPERFRGRYTIGYGYWELASYPRAWLPAMNLVDEIWAPSRFIADALTPVSSVPVVPMPIPVAFDPPPSASRTTLELPEGRFLFLFTFDLNSYIARKHPMAALDAFSRAFPSGSEPAGLVLKASLPPKLDPASEAVWRAVKEKALSDPRIRLFEGAWPKEKLLQMMAACDTYLSLHRAEGFGLGMAEAMVLGKPVLATDYSGNRDFCLPAHAVLVDYAIVPVGAEEYPYAEAQVWAEPDAEQAARHMRSFAEDPASARAMGKRAQAFMAREYGAERAGQRMRARLALLGLV